MLSPNEIIERLEEIYSNLRERKWEHIGCLIEFYKKKLNEEQEKTLRMMAFIYNINPPTSLSKSKGKNKSKKPIPHATILVHCILEDANVDIEKCKECETQCVSYLEEYKRLLS